MTVAIVGAGAVGAACAKAMLLRGACNRILLNDIDERKAQGLRNDLSHGEPFCPPTRIEATSLEQFADASIVVVTAGINERSGGAIDRKDPRGRLLLLPDNTRIYRDLIPRLAAAAPDAIILVVTDPPDALADVARHLSPGSRVISTGTLLDSLRFRAQIAARVDCHPGSVSAEVIGEHGTSQVYVWSRAHIGGDGVLKLAEARGLEPSQFRQEVEAAVKFANIEIIEGTGASQHGIGIVTARLVEAILRDERMVAPVGTYHPRFGATLSVPSVIGREGVVGLMPNVLSADEEQALAKSAEVIRESVAAVSHLLD